MPRLITLNSEQEAEPPRFCERWRTLAVATNAIEPAAARQAVRGLYLAAGGPEPKAIVMLPSPMACLIARGMVEILLSAASRDGLLERRFPQHLCAPRGESLCTDVWDRLWPQLQDQLGGRPWENLGEDLGDQLGALSCRDRGWNSLREDLRKEVDGLVEQFCNLHSGFRSRFGNRIWPQIGCRTCFQIETQIRDPLWRQISNQLHRHVANEISDRLEGILNDPEPDKLQPDEIEAQFKVLELHRWNDFAGGQEAHWLAPYDFAEWIGLQLEARARQHLDAHRNCARACGWIYPYRAIAFVSDRPAEIHFDAQNHLHHATGMAVCYRDGFGVHAWHGKKVPRWVIENRDAVTPQAIETLHRDEARLAAVQIYGFDRYLAQAAATVVASDELHGEPRCLLEWPLFLRGQPVRMIEVMNGSLEPDGSRRKFRLHALAGDTPAEVIAATYGIAPGHYREAVRT